MFKRLKALFRPPIVINVTPPTKSFEDIRKQQATEAFENLMAVQKAPKVIRVCPFCQKEYLWVSPEKTCPRKSCNDEESKIVIVKG